MHTIHLTFHENMYHLLKEKLAEFLQFKAHIKKMYSKTTRKSHIKLVPKNSLWMTGGALSRAMADSCLCATARIRSTQTSRSGTLAALNL